MKKTSARQNHRHVGFPHCLSEFHPDSPVFLLWQECWISQRLHIRIINDEEFKLAVLDELTG